ncbi:DUF262 domain-containing protein [Halogeometricum pallidum]|uniref:DUF262 domain-containing protein n=1 Tax=Halogeometricum pallidum TaxID=411361 RepID=UPI000A062F85|nr:DUF262 domain-containing protein [Halogeometricum pallidum]
MASVEQQQLGDLFPRSVFEIPSYQRGYSWTETQVRDLLEDIEYSFQERSSGAGDSEFVHYFGTVVLQNKGVEKGQTETFSSYNVIDGQQRITTVSVLMGCLYEELQNIAQRDMNEDHQVPPDRLAQDCRDDFICKHGTIRLSLDSINNETFENLVVHNDSTNTVPGENIAQRRLIEAKETIRKWLDEKKEGYREDNLDADEYYHFLKELGRTIRNSLEVTTYVIEDETEAGRLFEVVNDRGKDLTTLDRIKSYLVYCSSRHDDSDLSNKVYRKMGEVIRNITEHGGSDEDLEVFVNNHWMVFTGEVNRFRGKEYNEIHRRIKYLEKHAQRNLSQDSMRAWIEAYLASITACSEAYAKIENPNLIRGDIEYAQSIKSSLDAINQMPVSTNFYPILMASLCRFGISEEFDLITNLCEKFSFRVYNVADRRADAAGNPLRRNAYWIEWAGKNEQASEVFSGEETPIWYDNIDEALSEACKMFETQMGKHCTDSYFRDCLTRDDIFDGATENDGWTGVRNREAVRYLLYKYEKHLRKEGVHSTITQIPSFSQWKQEGITIEHIYPQTPEDDNDEGLDGVVHSLGNLILLGPKDNSGAGNLSYHEKYESIYTGSDMRMIEELPTPDEGWGVEQIRERRDKIVKFALEEWGNLSSAYVHVSSVPDNMDQDDIAQVAHDIRLDCSTRKHFRVPSVRFSQHGVNGEDGWEIVNSCPNCDGTLVKLKSTNEWNAECDGCGARLPDPVFKFRKSDYIIT